MPKQTIILASSSPYRRELLNKLNISFESISPDVDESQLGNETPTELVERLSLDKAKAIASVKKNSLIIGSDQVAVIDNEILTKPHTHNKAIEQLSKASGREVCFLTGLCLFNSQTNSHQLTCVTYKVKFLSLSEQQIEAYLQKEKPYDCAGSFKSEGLGITLFESMSGDDPNSLIGLPLIALTSMLRIEGLEPLS